MLTVCDHLVERFFAASAIGLRCCKNFPPNGVVVG